MPRNYKRQTEKIDVLQVWWGTPNSLATKTAPGIKMAKHPLIDWVKSIEFQVRKFASEDVPAVEKLRHAIEYLGEDFPNPTVWEFRSDALGMTFKAIIARIEPNTPVSKPPA